MLSLQMLEEIGGGCHGLRLQAIGRFPFTKRRRDDKAGFSLTSSMYRDLRKGAAVEVDHILGDFIERGDAHRVATPLLKAAFVNLRVYQDRLPKH